MSDYIAGAAGAIGVPCAAYGCYVFLRDATCEDLGLCAFGGVLVALLLLKDATELGPSVRRSLEVDEARPRAPRLEYESILELMMREVKRRGRLTWRHVRQEPEPGLVQFLYRATWGEDTNYVTVRRGRVAGEVGCLIFGDSALIHNVVTENSRRRS